MRRWFFLLACGLGCIPAYAQIAAPDPEATMPIPLSAPLANRDDGTIHDSIGLVSVRPLPDVIEAEPVYLQRVDYLRQHNDNITAISYLREIVNNVNILPQDRARVILELADCLSLQGEKAESLCWLKIWMQLYPTRPEFGAVAYRVGTQYMQMGLPDLARDAFYLALAHAVNQGEVKNANDVKEYTRLTEATLWGLAANEYQNGQWARAAQLFDRYRKEATTASSLSLEKAAFLQADCYYQLKLADKALPLYEQTLAQHPFNPLAPQARLRLYHLYLIKHESKPAEEDLEALVWTVRTVWPKEETYWQKQTAELLLALNQKDITVIPPLLQQSAQLPSQGKTWQDALNHYDTLVRYEAETTQASQDDPGASTGSAGAQHVLPEDEDLLAMDRSINQLPPAPRSDQ